MSEVGQKDGWPERMLARKPQGRIHLVEGESPGRLADLLRGGFELETYVPFQDVRERLEAVAQELEGRGEAAIDLTEEGQLYGEAAVIRENTLAAFPESSTGEAK